jgi:hypothetical protein
MTTFSIKDIQKLKPCKEYTEERLEELWEGKESLALREILELTIHIDDRNWVIPRLVSVEIVVKWAHLCAVAAEKHADKSAAGYAGYAAAWSARSAGYAARSAANAARYAGSTAGSAWSKNRGKELYRLLAILCDMEEDSTWKEYNSQESIIIPL